MVHNPAVVECPESVWVKVAEGVTSGTIHRLVTLPEHYLHTYRNANDPAPIDNSDAALLFSGVSVFAAISNDTSIDVYVKAIGANGRIRVDA